MGAYCKRAEELGFGSIWVSELTTVPIFEPLVLLSHVAAHTEHIRLGVAVILIPLRIPIQFAAQVATLDRLSGGRLILGVGLGSSTALYAAYGLPVERRVRRYGDALDLVKRLWSGESVTYAGEWWQLQKIRILKPIQDPRPPLWFGARRGRALRRAVERGDGWVISGSASPEEYAKAINEVQQHLIDLDRDPSGFVIAKRVYITVTNRVVEARRSMADWFGEAYGNSHLVDTLALIGNAEQCAEQLVRLRHMGVTNLILNPVFDADEQLEALGAELLPLLR